MTEDQIRKMVKVGKQLRNISREIDYFKEIMFFLKDHLEYLDDIANLLDDGQELVAAEVCHWLNKKSDGNFSYEMNYFERKKYFFCKEGTSSYWQEMIGALRTCPIIVACNWDLTDSDKKTFERAERGDTIHVEAPLTPVMLDGKKGIGLPIFTNYLEVPEDYRREKTFQECRFEYLMAWAKSIKQGMHREVFFVIDMFDDACVEVDTKIFDQKVLKKYIGKDDPLVLRNNKIYEVLSIEDHQTKGDSWYRIIDETGDGYLYPARFFVDADEQGYVDLDVCEYVKEMIDENSIHNIHTLDEETGKWIPVHESKT